MKTGDPMHSARHTLAAVATLLLAGCANTSSMVAVGPHTYKVTETASVLKGGANVAAQAAFAAAGKRCKEDGEGRTVTPLKTHEVSSLASVPTLSNGYAVTFRCAAPDPNFPPDNRPAQ
ncbi:MAG TPA: hypothetical protein VND87_08110 [Stellaceae bacterium]|nr:hypothetical protein [Stellaceae bacterium]